MGFRDVCPRPARSWCEGSSIRVPSPLVTTRHGRAARVGAAATAAATRGAGVAGEPLRRVDAPTPLLLRSPPLAKVQSHSHHLLRQVLFAYLAVPRPPPRGGGNCGVPTGASVRPSRARGGGEQGGGGIGVVGRGLGFVRLILAFRGGASRQALITEVRAA